MRIITWNMRRATGTSSAWKCLEDLNPDVALLQEVSSIPPVLYDLFDIKFLKTINKNGKPQKFGNAILVHGKIINELLLTSEYEWVQQELSRFSGNLLSCKVKPVGCPSLNIISVYSPAWPVDTSKYQDIDITTIKLKLNPKLWVTEILWSALKNVNLSESYWIVGGDLNCSETFDSTFSSGNQEILDRMEALGFSECLRKYSGKLTPTYKNLKGGKVIHQMDHLFVTDLLFSTLSQSTAGDNLDIFEKSISDHLPIIADFNNILGIPAYLENFINSKNRVFAKTMPEIPHFYIVRDYLSEKEKPLFDEFDDFIKMNGYTEEFCYKQYTYINFGNYKYWVIENILNRAVRDKSNLAKG